MTLHPSPQKPSPLERIESAAIRLQAKLEKLARPKPLATSWSLTPFVRGELNPVGFQDRLLASAIDTLISFFLLYHMMKQLANILFGEQRADLLYGGMIGRTNPEELSYILNQTPYLHDWALNNLLHLLVFGGLVIWCWQSMAATPGKWLLRMRVVDIESGLTPSLKQSVIRYSGYFLAFLPFGLGFLSIIRDPKKQGWHDKMSRTLVVRVPHWRFDSSRISVYSLLDSRPLPEDHDKTLAS